MSKRTSKILQDCSTIGAKIKSFVQDLNVGADACRHTGVLTFNGNAKLGSKQKNSRTCKKKCSVVFIVELCIPRNKRRHSAKRYEGLARVSTRRATQCS